MRRVLILALLALAQALGPAQAGPATGQIDRAATAAEGLAAALEEVVAAKGKRRDATELRREALARLEASTARMAALSREPETARLLARTAGECAADQRLAARLVARDIFGLTSVAAALRRLAGLLHRLGADGGCSPLLRSCPVPPGIALPRASKRSWRVSRANWLYQLYQGVVSCVSHFERVHPGQAQHDASSIRRVRKFSCVLNHSKA